MEKFWFNKNNAAGQKIHINETALSSMHIQPEILPVVKSQIGELSTMLAEAFQDDPVIRWFFPKEGSWHQKVSQFFALHLKQKIRHKTAFTNCELSGCAMWDAPINLDRSAWEKLEFKLNLIKIHGFDMGRVAKGRQVFEGVHPHFPHWYLSVLGVSPSRQGQGIGTALVRQTLANCDREGLPAYVETAHEKGLTFYTRLGFDVTGEYQLPKGPLIFTMLREPQPG